MMQKKSPLYISVVAIGRQYLGPAGERFMRRQIETHLSIDPEDITHNDIDELVTWSRLAFAMLTDDSKHIDAFSESVTRERKSSASSLSAIVCTQSVNPPMNSP